MTLQELYDEAVERFLKEEYKRLNDYCTKEGIYFPKEFSIDRFKTHAVNSGFILGMSARIKDPAIPVSEENVCFIYYKSFKSKSSRRPYAKIINDIEYGGITLNSVGWSHVVNESHIRTVIEYRKKNSVKDLVEKKLRNKSRYSTGCIQISFAGETMPLTEALEQTEITNNRFYVHKRNSHLDDQRAFDSTLHNKTINVSYDDLMILAREKRKTGKSFVQIVHELIMSLDY